MILGIGVDILQTSRLQGLNKRHASGHGLRLLARRILHPTELLAWEELSRSTEASERFLATRWAAKEAVYKALYPHHKLQWKQVSVDKVSEKPSIVFHNKEIPELKTHLSLAHDGGYVIAYVVAET